MGESVVLSCSALRREYRQRLAAAEVEPFFVHLSAPRDLIARRLDERKGHYMPSTLLESQLETLEPPGSGERCITISTAGCPEEIVDRLLTELGSG